jgi:hypothetical protein
MVIQVLSAVYNHFYNVLFLVVQLTIMLAVGMRVFSFLKITGLRTLERGLFSLGIGIGITGYLIYFIGLVHLLNVWLVMILLLAAILLLGKEYKTISRWIMRAPKVCKHIWARIRKNTLYMWVSIPVIAFSALAFVGASTPEYEFDALWYHLTLPKIYILDHFIHYVPGTLLYYSVFPRLTEMMYTLGLLVGNDLVAKMFHFAFGLLFAASVFAMGRKFFSAKVGLLAALILCTSLDVIWLIRLAYIDLATAFFGTLAVFALMLWVFADRENAENKKQRSHLLIVAGIFSGLLLATKDWGLMMLPAEVFVIFVSNMARKEEKKFEEFFKHAAILVGIALVIVLPWYIDAYIHTGNPLYPVGSIHSPEDYGAATGATDWITRVWPRSILPFGFHYLTSAFTPILGLFILAPFVWKRISMPAKYFFGFGVVYYVFYSFIPTHQYFRYSFGGFAVFGILAIYLFFELFKTKWLKAVGAFVMVVPMVVNFAMLVHLTKDQLKVFAGVETRDSFLNRTIARNAYGFYDRDGYFAKNFGDGSKGRIFTYNLHNLFYVDFPFAVYENKDVNFSNVHSAQDFKTALQDEGISYVLLKNSEIEALWKRLGEPSSLEDFSKMFVLEYSVPQDSLNLYILQ